MDLKYWLFVGSSLAFSSLLAFSLILIAASKVYPIITRSKKEKCFYNPLKEQTFEFPSISDAPSINLSVVVPAYNEEKRLGPMLDECLNFLENRLIKLPSFLYEVIVISDGSTDNTVNKALTYSKKYGTDKVRVLELELNRGKGGAVRLGMLSARGALVLFADADGATKFSDLEKLELNIKELINCDYQSDLKTASEKQAIIVGSRAHLEEQAIASRTFFRTILMYGFHFLVWLFAVKGIKDTQCGFKLLTRQAARVCFESLHVERWAFDVELLYIAQKLHIPIGEVSVNWTEIEGSKVTPFWSWIQMGVDLGLIWLRYTIGAWKIKSNLSNNH
ncbi:dolichyl-phosphate beta-glucosyltransferase [Euwallacea similis]|uniref:dolichyl-phosphate beta-glucosyltransferase n=1 Tax=Euwallacea similis TaxID=1736056 RepID=UPI00344DDA35